MSQSEPKPITELRKMIADDGDVVPRCALACGMSVSGVQKIVREKRLPRNRLVRAALEKFVSKNGGGR